MKKREASWRTEDPKTTIDKACEIATTKRKRASKFTGYGNHKYVEFSAEYLPDSIVLKYSNGLDKPKNIATINPHFIAQDKFIADLFASMIIDMARLCRNLEK